MTDEIRVRAAGEHVLTGFHLPQLDGFVQAGGGETPAVGTEGHADNTSAVTLENENALAGQRVIDFHGAVGKPTSQGQAAAVGAKPYAPAGVGMTVQRTNLPGLRHVPNLYRALPAHREQPSAVRAEAHAEDLV